MTEPGCEMFLATKNSTSDHPPPQKKRNSSSQMAPKNMSLVTKKKSQLANKIRSQRRALWMDGGMDGWRSLKNLIRRFGPFNTE